MTLILPGKDQNGNEVQYNLGAMDPTQLERFANELGLECSGKDLSHIRLQVLKSFSAEGKDILGEGVLELHQDGYGFLRSKNNSYAPSADDLYLSPGLIRKNNLKKGNTISGKVRTPKSNERYPALVHIDTIDGVDASESKRRVAFESLTPLFPDQSFNLRRGSLASRIIAMAAPQGKGQRTLIVAPPKAGKTMLMQDIAQSITENNPECVLIVLLIDERPEEVTDMRRSVNAEVVASTFDEPASRHVQVAETVIEKAKRLVEQGHDVVVLLDSITRLARAYNTVAPSSGKVLTGGVDANALHKPKRFFGAARNIEEGGSLSIIATALIDTGSKMDEVIYEEFKGTGNSEVHLSREIAEKRVYPAININRSGTRREEMITDSDELKKMWVLRKILHPMDEIAAIEFLISRLRKTKSNEEFFEDMKS